MYIFGALITVMVVSLSLTVLYGFIEELYAEYLDKK